MAKPGQALLALQELDLTIDQHQARLQAIHDGVPIADAVAQVDALKKKLDATTTAAKAAARDAERFEAEAEALHAERKSLEKRLYSGEIASVKEVEKMQARMQHLHDQADALEQQALEAMERAQTLSEEVERLQARVAEAERRLAEQRAALAGEAATLKAQLDAALQQQAQARAAVEPALLDVYDRHRRRRGGHVVAALIDGQCGACRVAASVSVRNQLRQQPTAVCEHCGRLLVDAGDA